MNNVEDEPRPVLGGVFNQFTAQYRRSRAEMDDANDALYR